MAQGYGTDDPMRSRLFGLGALLLATISAAAAPARAEGPGPEMKRYEDEKPSRSPDKTLQIEQYVKGGGTVSFAYEHWVFDKNHKNPYLLNHDEDLDEFASYPAGFRFSPDSKWLVRMQGTGAGFATLILYKRDGNRFELATKKTLGDLAWDYFFTQPVSQGMPTEPGELNHKRADLLKGMEENYAWLGVKWPNSRYIAITLQFDIQGNERPTPWIEGWRCVYDTQTGEFSVPSVFAEHNAKARKMPKPKAAKG